MAIPSEEARGQTIRAALAAADRKSDAERVRIAWKDSDLMTTVIEIPLASVVLNPRSHRIRAQLESSQKRELVQRDPFSDDAQAVIADLLRNTERFDELRDNLKDAGQIDPGVVTHTGLLVNANTRCVALRELGSNRYIRVAVLPEDAPEEEIDRLELRLQMKRDFRRDYTFTNELLFIEDLVKKYKYKPREIALEMGWSSKSNNAGLKRAEEQVQQSIRMLTIIREVQELSSGEQLQLTNFDDARQSISELDDEYERLKKNDPAAAARLRDTRLVALLSGVGYREMRLIDETFLDDYLADALEEQESFKGRVDAILNEELSGENGEVPGLDILETEDATSGERSAAPLLTLLAETAGHENITLSIPSEGDVRITRSRFVADLKAAVDSAAEDARADRQKGDLLDRPLLFARRALRHLNTAAEAYEHAKADHNFDKRPLRRVLDEVGRAQKAFLEKLGG
jgi:FtsZ-binding cell division protein ZapB